VLADLDVIAKAPAGLNASGYADLIAKIPAGADWIVADALGAEAIQPAVWDTVQKRLHAWVGAPEKIAANEPGALKQLVYGLMMTGFAMQAARSSRPASGAEHQFSHLWDMQHHRHNGETPSHGFKVGIGTLASIALYEELMSHDLSALDVDEAVSRWPSLPDVEQRVTAVLGSGELAEKAIEETRAKYASPNVLREQLTTLRSRWTELREKLNRQLLPFAKVKSMLRTAGCAFEPEQIGISRERLRQSYKQALFIRRRFTALDLAHRLGLLEESLSNIFGHGGAFGP
jgi:glycerol-1-phosphate dehydrogenase [NAD(P)+]